MRRLLLDLNGEGQTILLVTHDVELAATTAHRTIELVDGAVARDVVNPDGACRPAGTGTAERPSVRRGGTHR